MKILAGMIKSVDTGKFNELQNLINKSLTTLDTEVGKITGKKRSLYFTHINYENNRLTLSLDLLRSNVESHGIAPELELWLTPRGILQASAHVVDIKSGADIASKRVGEINYNGVDPYGVYWNLLKGGLNEISNWHPDAKQSGDDLVDQIYLFYKNTLFRILRKYSTDPSKPQVKASTHTLTAANASLNALYQKGSSL